MKKPWKDWAAYAYQDRVAKLKKILVDAKDFSDVFNYFMDHLGEDPGFLMLGRRGESELLTKIVTRIARQVLGKKVELDSMLVVEIPELQFIHGTGTVQDWIFNMFLFVDSDIGLVAMVPSSEKKGRLNYMCRFSAYWDHDGKVPLFVPNPDQDIVH